MIDKETGLSRVSSMREVQALLYEYREEDIQIPYLLAECVDYLIAERERLLKAIKKHRRDMWGNGVVSHLYDKNLYAALQEDRDD